MYNIYIYIYNYSYTYSAVPSPSRRRCPRRSRSRPRRDPGQGQVRKPASDEAFLSIGEFQWMPIGNVEGSSTGKVTMCASVAKVRAFRLIPCSAFRQSVSLQRYRRSVTRAQPPCTPQVYRRRQGLDCKRVIGVIGAWIIIFWFQCSPNSLAMCSERSARLSKDSLRSN